METVPEIFGKLSNEIIQGSIRFRPESHEYFHIPTNNKLTPVSRVIDTVFSTKSWDGVKPEVVENARDRGVAVDRYMAEYVKSSRVQIEPDESPEVRDRVITAHRIWEEEFSGLPAETQKIVFSLKDGVAGTMDFWIDRRIILDLKNTYGLEKSFVLQLGAYSEYAPESPERACVLHISPKVYRAGGMLVEYNVASCRAYWRHAVEWWLETQSMKR